VRSEPFDCVVIGAGPGGYVAAIRAAQLGMTTAVVEKGAVGGRCVNYACIPAKAVLRAADVLEEVRDAHAFGISAGEPTIDFGSVQARRANVVKTLTGGVGGLLKKNGIAYIEGSGSVTAGGDVKVVGRARVDDGPGELLGAHIVGAKPTELIYELVGVKRPEGGYPEIARMIHGHPTLSEAVLEAARAADGWLIQG
jgi:pyruvate/2-oxoglutarate dehydrogenase complex dihydrolipoamide dehydrogenase (E3) component